MLVFTIWITKFIMVINKSKVIINLLYIKIWNIINSNNEKKRKIKGWFIKKMGISLTYNEKRTFNIFKCWLFFFIEIKKKLNVKINYKKEFEFCFYVFNFFFFFYFGCVCFSFVLCLFNDVLFNGLIFFFYFKIIIINNYSNNSNLIIFTV